MKRLTSIVAMNHEGVIGCGNALPWRLQQDMQFFKQETVQNVVLMGRKTYDSLGGRCLPRRYNVVISHTFGLFPETENCVAAQGIEQALHRASKAPKQFQETFIIGGASMYEQFAPYVDRYLVTIVNKSIPGADTFFPTNLIGNEDDWQMECLGEARQNDLNESSFAVFELVSKNQDAVLQRRCAAIAQIRSRAVRSSALKLPPRKNRHSGGDTRAGQLSWA